MTAFATVPLSSITIDRSVRQRRELTDIEELAASIAQVGLINPIVIDRETMTLIAGERRFTACTTLGWTEIPVHYLDQLSARELYQVELEENIRRVDLTWQEHNDAVAALHAMYAEEDPEWTQAQSAKRIGISAAAVADHLQIKAAREANVNGIEETTQWSTARNIARRNAERKRNDALQELDFLPAAAAQPESEGEAEPAALPVRRVEILNADFTEWTHSNTRKFNFIHCDFPYGVNTGDKSGQSAAKSIGHYDDGADVYFNLLAHFVNQQDTFVADQAHLMFWFSMKYYKETVEAFTSAGWRVDPFPLIWHKSDNAGVIPDANRGPRRTYETALHCHRGDAKIVGPVANSFAAPTTKQFHTSEKSEAMLTHFFRMYVDEHSVVLDPTCGSGMAIRAAEKAGAAYAVGLEKGLDFWKGARQNLGL